MTFIVAGYDFEDKLEERIVLSGQVVRGYLGMTATMPQYLLSFPFCNLQLCNHLHEVKVANVPASLRCKWKSRQFFHQRFGTLADLS